LYLRDTIGYFPYRDPVEHKDKLTEDSPITYLKGVQGANDPRVVKADSDQFVEALKKEGSQVKYVVLEDEGHGFSKKENEINVYKKILNFFDQQLVL
jgi:dipeptidyl aminopeptidase/acylaminoacyl peptidase